MMRVLPLAVWHFGSDDALIADAHTQSLVTHGHARAQVCCAIYCLWARYTLRGLAQPWDAAIKATRTHYRAMKLEGHERELEFHLRPDEPHKTTGSGYVVDALFSARWASEQGNFETVIRSAIRLGHDTDTTACLAGGIAGLRVGTTGLPQQWFSRLRGQNLVEPLLDALDRRLERQQTRRTIAISGCNARDNRSKDFPSAMHLVNASSQLRNQSSYGSSRAIFHLVRGLSPTTR